MKKYIRGGKLYGVTSKGKPDKRFVTSRDIREAFAKKKRKPKCDFRCVFTGFVLGMLATAIISFMGEWNRIVGRLEVMYPVDFYNLDADHLSRIAVAASDPIEPAVCDEPFGDLFCAYDDWDVKRMYAIGLCESDNPHTPGPRRMDPSAININHDGSIDRGILQINSATYDDMWDRHFVAMSQTGTSSHEDTHDPITAVKVGHVIWLDQGYNWSSHYGICFYKEFDQL